jgi:hypothetical protein
MYGRTLPALVATLLPFELSMFWIYRDIQNIVLFMVALTLVTPPFMAAFVAPAASAAMTPFIARRPVSGASLIGAKLKTALASTAAAWTMVLLAMPLALFLSGAMEMAMRPMHLLIDVFGAPRVWLLISLGVVALIASTWKQLVQSLCIGMSGRPWLVKGSVFVRLSAILVLGPAATWIVRDAHRFTVAWNAIPAVVAALAGVKVVAAAIVIARLRRRQLFTDRELLLAVAAWDLAVFGLFALLAWSVPGLLVSGAFLLGGSILAVPLVRLAAAPLAIVDKRCG